MRYYLIEVVTMKTKLTEPGKYFNSKIKHLKLVTKQNIIFRTKKNLNKDKI